MSRTRFRAALLTVLLAVGCQTADAVTTTLNVTGNIILPPPCVINGDQLIAVDFTNEVMTTRVDGINYRQQVPYTLVCTGQTSNALKMQILGMDAGFQGALQTTKGDLGIALSNGDQPMPINSVLNFTLPDQPNLFATLVKRPGTTLTAGDFAAGATMVINYQ